MIHHDEIKRLEHVYEAYHKSKSFQLKWSDQNAGNRAILKERTKKISDLLHKSRLFPLREKKFLEIGCGSGKVLRSLKQLGAADKNLFGIDLLLPRLKEAQKQSPSFKLCCANAENLCFPDQVFDVVLIFTVFSSILNPEMAQNIAREASLLLKKSGIILIYDFRYHSPANANVRKITLFDLTQLFPAFKMDYCLLTLAPPLARRLGKMTPILYPALSVFPFLRTHLLVMLFK